MSATRRFKVDSGYTDSGNGKQGGDADNALTHRTAACIRSSCCIVQNYIRSNGHKFATERTNESDDFNDRTA